MDKSLEVSNRSELKFGQRLRAFCNSLNHIHIRFRPKGLLSRADLKPFVLMLLLMTLAVLVFIQSNFVKPRTGLWRAVVCVDMDTGSILWNRPIFAASQERKHSDNSFATPTACTDGEHIIVSFGLGIACLDFNGNILWRKEDEHYLNNTRYGSASSPLIVGDKVIVLQEREDRAHKETWLAAFNKKTGQVHWQIWPDDIFGSYTTPLIYRDQGGINQLLISTYKKIVSYDIATGKRLWSLQTNLEQQVASMARSGVLLCASGGTWGPKETVMTLLDGIGADTNPQIIWKVEGIASQDCSPVIYENKLFVIDDKGKIVCFDALSGEIFWKKRLRGGRYLASLTAGDGKIYTCSTKGLTTVLAADTEFRIIAKNDLKGRCYSSPAFADGCILLRIDGQLYCIEKGKR
jgi:outer membrane protein assembly factor BamB